MKHWLDVPLRGGEYGGLTAWPHSMGDNAVHARSGGRRRHEKLATARGCDMTMLVSPRSAGTHLLDFDRCSRRMAQRTEA